MIFIIRIVAWDVSRKISEIIKEYICFKTNKTEQMSNSLSGVIWLKEDFEWRYEQNIPPTYFKWVV